MTRKVSLFPRAVLAAVLLAACSSPDTPAAGRSLETSPKTPVGPLDHPPVDPGQGPIVSAEAQRLSVQQLRQSFPVTMGTTLDGAPITWLDGKKPGLDLNADTLGEADYIALTQDSKEAAPLYAKFMDDAARSVCDQAVEADYAKTTVSDRVLLRYVGNADTAKTNAAGLDQNLRYLALRMHAVKIADEDAASIAPLRTLFTTTVEGLAAGQTPTEVHVKEGWRVVCVALVTAPEFHIY